MSTNMKYTSWRRCRQTTKSKSSRLVSSTSKTSKLWSQCKAILRPCKPRMPSSRPNSCRPRSNWHRCAKKSTSTRPSSRRARRRINDWVLWRITLCSDLKSCKKRTKRSPSCSHVSRAMSFWTNPRPWHCSAATQYAKIVLRLMEIRRDLMLPSFAKIASAIQKIESFRETTSSQWCYVVKFQCSPYA